MKHVFISAQSMGSSRCVKGDQHDVLHMRGKQRTLTMLLHLRQGLRQSCSLKTHWPRSQLPWRPPSAALHVLIQFETFESRLSVSFEDRCMPSLRGRFRIRTSFDWRLAGGSWVLMPRISNCPAKSERSNWPLGYRHTSSKLRPTSICPGEMQLIRTPVPAQDNVSRQGEYGGNDVKTPTLKSCHSCLHHAQSRVRAHREARSPTSYR